MARPNTGIWLIGARGGVAATTIVGLAALKKDLIAPTGLVSALPQFAGLPFAAWGDFLVGGHEIREARLSGEAMGLATESRAIDAGLIVQVEAELDEIDQRIRPGTVHKVGPTIAAMASTRVPSEEPPREAIARLKNDVSRFAESHALEHVIVVNVASTEPPVDPSRLPPAWTELKRTLDRPDDCLLPASSLYAIAALELGCSYINFTPSLGSSPAAIDELARTCGARHMGCDGKTGETLMKSVLAPMFQHRNLRVMSWVGHNIFGNMDGRVLNDPANKQTKVASKDHLLAEILGYRPQTLVSIEYIESLGDWKTAWDHIHFTGFLGTPMTLQFIWQGCDSLLAAPLVLDLVRFTDLARRRGETGLLRFLASFFKSPYGVSEHSFVRQFQALESWAERVES
ncbi:MAG: inositol-3-phosphate synthase [Pirellulales bacterium]|nr:inositol-3-phosphate synthase [Pirellulales bacterium]